MSMDVSEAMRTQGKNVPFEDTMPIDLGRDDWTIDGQATICGDMTCMGESISVQGEITVHGTAHCARCLTTFPASLTTQFDEAFVREGNVQESDLQDPDVHSYQGTIIDLAPMATSALLLDMPMRFLCKKSCGGLCPTCGKDRNTDGCVCDSPRENNPFSALRSLLILTPDKNSER